MDQHNRYVEVYENYVDWASVTHFEATSMIRRSNDGAILPLGAHEAKPLMDLSCRGSHAKILALCSRY
jgi:hypothetical protein